MIVWKNCIISLGVVILSVTALMAPACNSTDYSILVPQKTHSNPDASVNCPVSVGETQSASCAMQPIFNDLLAGDFTCSLNSATTCSGVTLTGCELVEMSAQGEAAGPGTCNIVIDVMDDFSPPGTAQGTATIVIEEEQQAPTITIDCPANVAETGAAICGIVAEDADLPAEVVECSLDPLTTCAGVTLNGCESAHVPAQGEAFGPGLCTVAVNAQDSNAIPGAAQAGSEIIIDEVNRSPYFQGYPYIEDIELMVNESFNGNIYPSVYDSDLPRSSPSDPGYLTCSNGGQTCPFDVTVSGSGEGSTGCNISFTAGSSNGHCNVIVQISDGYGASISADVNIRVYLSFFETMLNSAIATTQPILGNFIIHGGVLNTLDNCQCYYGYDCIENPSCQGIDLSGSSGIYNNYTDGVPLPTIFSSCVDPLNLDSNGNPTLDSRVLVNSGYITMSGTAQIGSPTMKMKLVLVDMGVIPDDFENIYTEHFRTGVGNFIDIFGPSLADFPDIFNDNTGELNPQFQEAFVTNATTLTNPGWCNLNSGTPSIIEAGLTWDTTIDLLSIASDTTYNLSNLCGYGVTISNITYRGKATFYLGEAPLTINGNFIVASGESFPSTSNWAFINADQQLFATMFQSNIMGLFYSQHQIQIGRQANLAGIIVTQELETGPNVPNIFLAPNLKQHASQGFLSLFNEP